MTLAFMHSARLSSSPQLRLRPRITNISEDSRIYAELSKVPAKDRNRANPLANDQDAVAAGSNLYDQHCPIVMETPAKVLAKDQAC